MSYVFSRDTASVEPDWHQMAANGVTVALNAEDPHLAHQIELAQQAGAKFAIWIPAIKEGDPVAYGKQMAAIAQHYKPSAILPNVESLGEGADGSQWSHQMMAEYSKYMRPGDVKLDVVVEPNKPNSTTGSGKDFFDYSPYLKYGGVVAEAFGGNMQQMNPTTLRDMLVRSGVPPDKINMLLAPGQDSSGIGGNFSMYTLDDMKPDQLATFLHNYSTSPDTQPATGGGNTSTTPAPDTSSDPNQLPDAAPRVTDAHNPAALRYSRFQLAKLAKQGITPKQFGLQGLDPTAQWRALSAITGAQQAMAAGQGGNYVIPAGLPQNVTDYIHNMIAGPGAAGAHTPAENVPPGTPDTTAVPPPGSGHDPGIQGPYASPASPGIAAAARARALANVGPAISVNRAPIGGPQLVHPVGAPPAAPGPIVAPGIPPRGTLPNVFGRAQEVKPIVEGTPGLAAVAGTARGRIAAPTPPHTATRRIPIEAV